MNFPNAECSSAAGDDGVCMTRAECGDIAGRVSGACAQVVGDIYIYYLLSTIYYTISTIHYLLGLGLENESPQIELLHPEPSSSQHIMTFYSFTAHRMMP